MSTSHISPLALEPNEVTLSQYYSEHHAMLSKAEIEYATVADGRSLNAAGRYEFVPEEPVLVLRLGGSLAQVKMGLGGGQGGGTRGEILGFSSGARRRLMRMIASIERSVRPIFVTLTYPDVFPGEIEKWKRDLDVFGKRLIREFEDAGFIWRIEFKERMSGKGKGEIAPHFHLLVYGAGFNLLRAWVAEAWWGVVGSKDNDHLMAGTRVEHIYSYGGIMRYVGKYIAKEDSYPDFWRGKAWGVIGRKALPWAIEVIISLSGDQAIRLTRLGRKMIKAKGRSFNYGLTWIVNAERVLDYLEYLAGFT